MGNSQSTEVVDDQQDFRFKVLRIFANVVKVIYFGACWVTLLVDELTDDTPIDIQYELKCRLTEVILVAVVAISFLPILDGWYQTSNEEAVLGAGNGKGDFPHMTPGITEAKDDEDIAERFTDLGTAAQGTQTDEYDFETEIEDLQKKNEESAQSWQRDLLQLKRLIAKRVKETRASADSKNKTLSEIQVKLLPLEKQRVALLSEKEAIEKQLDEEQRRNLDLVKRFERLHQLLIRDGQSAIIGINADAQNNREP